MGYEHNEFEELERILRDRGHAIQAQIAAEQERQERARQADAEARRLNEQARLLRQAYEQQKEAERHAASEEQIEVLLYAEKVDPFRQGAAANPSSTPEQFESIWRQSIPPALLDARQGAALEAAKAEFRRLPPPPF